MRSTPEHVESMYRTMDETSRVAASVSPVGLNAHATTGPHPYNWAEVLRHAPDSAVRALINKLSAMSGFGIPVDTTTLLDYSAAVLGGRGNSHTGKRIVLVASSMRIDHFAFLALIGSASDDELQASLVADLRRNLNIVGGVGATKTLAAIRLQLGDHAGDTSIAPHYVADVVSMMGLRRALNWYGGPL